MKPDEAEQLQQEVEDQVDNLQKKIAKPNEESEISSEQGTPSASRSNSTSQLSNSDDKSKNMVNQLFSSIQFWKSSQPKPERPPKSATQTLTRSDSKTSLKPHYPTEKSAEEGSLVTPDDQPQTSKEKFLTLFKIFINTFGLIFIAEWGDRSQLATIVLASTNDVGGIILGSIVGHTICSSLAVIAGALIARWISVRVVTVIGGIVFISFAIASLIIGFEDPASAIDDL
jgi:putative Ca2+/H+ antiporter (TMEM165/GDT1 family)